MKIVVDDLSHAVAQLATGRDGLRDLFWHLGYDPADALLPLPPTSGVAALLAVPPRRVASACDGEFTVVWLEMCGALDRAAQKRLIGCYDRLYPHALYVFSAAGRRSWHFTCPLPAGGDAGALRVELSDLSQSVLRHVAALSTGEGEHADEYSDVSRFHERCAAVCARSAAAPDPPRSEKDDTRWRDAVAWWMTQVGGRLLSADEEQRLARRIQHGDGKAKAALVENNFRLVVSIARRYQNSGLPLSDLVQEGNIGLITAAERFNPSFGYRFSTYATQWIRQHIGRAVDNHSRLIRLPSHVHESLRKVESVRHALWSEGGDEPTAEQIATRLGVEPTWVARLLGDDLQEPASLDGEVGEDGGTALGALLRNYSASDPLAVVFAADLRREADALLASLDPRAALVLRLRLGLDGEEEHTLEQVGAALNVTRERARQIQAGALNKLRTGVRERRLRDYLEAKLAPTKPDVLPAAARTIIVPKTPAPQFFQNAGTPSSPTDVLALRLSESTVSRLVAAGFNDVKDIAAASDSDLLRVPGVGAGKVKDIRKRIASLYAISQAGGGVKAARKPSFTTLCECGRRVQPEQQRVGSPYLCQHCGHNGAARVLVKRTVDDEPSPNVPEANDPAHGKKPAPGDESDAFEHQYRSRFLTVPVSCPVLTEPD